MSFGRVARAAAPVLAACALAGCQAEAPRGEPEMILAQPIAVTAALLKAADIRENRGRLPLSSEAHEVQQSIEGNARITWSVLEGAEEKLRFIVTLSPRTAGSTALTTQVFVSDLRGGLRDDEQFVRISELATFREWVDATVHRRRYDEIGAQRQFLGLYDSASPDFQHTYRDLGEAARRIVESGIMPKRWR
jgi:hypothetical protein